MHVPSWYMRGEWRMNNVLTEHPLLAIMLQRLEHLQLYNPLAQVLSPFLIKIVMNKSTQVGIVVVTTAALRKHCCSSDAASQTSVCIASSMFNTTLLITCCSSSSLWCGVVLWYLCSTTTCANHMHKMCQPHAQDVPTTCNSAAVHPCRWPTSGTEWLTGVARWRQPFFLPRTVLLRWSLSRDTYDSV